MAVTPNTNIKLLKVPIEIDNKNQLTFTNATTQYNYFNSLPKIEVDKCTYQRKDNIIRFPAHIDSILEFNYVMYQNTNYTNKWFYAFITNMEYINDSLTNITISTDVFQTWQFDITFKQSFIEREMLSVSEDVAGSNLLPENLETGEFKIGGEATFEDLEPIPVVAYSGDKIPNVPGIVEQDLPQGGYTINGIASSVVFLFCENENFIPLLNSLQKSNYSDYIVSIFTVPKLAIKDFMIPANQITSSTALPIYALKNPNDYMQSILTKTLVSTPSSLDGYTPRNQKLKTYPYMYLGFNPSNGSQKIYRYENFTNGTPVFNIISEVNPNPTIYFIPQNYRGQTGNSMSDIASMNGYPTLSQRNDYFNTWLAQNSNIIGLQMEQEEFNYKIDSYKMGFDIVGNALSVMGGNFGAALNIAESGLTAASLDTNHDFYIKNQMAQIEKQKMLPDKVSLGNSNATLLGYNLMKTNIFTRYTIKRQFAERIDKFFDMYGYLTNNVKIPNLNNRPNWNYVKTIGANILGNIPQEDLQSLKNIFDNGVTLWHNSATFLDYSQNNR